MSHRDNTKNYDVGGINCSELKRNVQQCWHNLARDTETVDAGWNALKEYLSCQNIKAMQEEDCIDMGKKVRHIYWAMKYVLHGNCIYGNDKAVQNQKFGTAPRSTARRCSFMSRDDFIDFENCDSCIYAQIYADKYQRPARKSARKKTVLRYIEKHHNALWLFLESIDVQQDNLWKGFSQFIRKHRHMHLENENYIEINKYRVTINETHKSLVTWLNVSVPSGWNCTDWGILFRAKAGAMTEKMFMAMRKKAGSESKAPSKKKNSKKKSVKGTLVKQSTANNTLVDTDEEEDDRSKSRAKDMEEGSSTKKNKPSSTNIEALQMNILVCSFEHIKILKQWVPKTSKLFRCVSMRDGCHNIPTNQSLSIDSSKIHSLEYPNHQLLHSAQFFWTKIHKKVPCNTRIGIIQYISFDDSEAMVPFRSSHDMATYLIVLVLDGEITITRKKMGCRQETGATTINQSKWVHLGPDESFELLGHEKSSILIYHYFTACLTDMIDKKLDPKAVVSIKKGFEKSGIELREQKFNRGASTSEVKWYLPLFDNQFDTNCQRANQEGSFNKAISLFLKTKYKQDLAEGSSLSWPEPTKDNCANIESNIKKLYGIDISLKIIINEFMGFRIIESKSRKNEKKDNQCVIYLCNVRLPTIRSFQKGNQECDNRQYVLMEEASCDHEDKNIPYYSPPSIFDPYEVKRTLCNRKLVALNIGKRGGHCRFIPKMPEPRRSCNIQERLCMNDNEKMNIPELKYTLQSAVDVLRFTDQIDLTENVISNVGNGKIIHDTVLNVVLLG